MSESTEEFERFGAPIYYVNVAIAEPAGGENVRVWNCARKHGMLVPQCEIIIPASDLIIAAAAVRHAAARVFTRDQLTGRNRH